jgi:hypothetical protein
MNTANVNYTLTMLAMIILLYFQLGFQLASGVFAVDTAWIDGCLGLRVAPPTATVIGPAVNQ